MTSEEKQEIINAVLAALRTNSKSIDQLTPVSEMLDADFLELNGGRKVSYGVLFANHMSNDDAQEAWEYLDANKVDKDSRGLVEVHQAPVVYLDAMNALDGHSLNNGDNGLEYRSDFKRIYDFPGGLNLPPTAGAVYISKNNFKKFVWNGTDMEELKADECPLFVDYSEPVSFATLPVGGSYYVPSSHKIAVKIDASSTKTYDPLPDALYFFRDKGMIYTWKSSTNKWVPAGSDIKVVNNLTDGGEGDALSAEMGKVLRIAIMQIYNALGAYAFPNGKPILSWGSTVINNSINVNGVTGSLTITDVEVDGSSVGSLPAQIVDGKSLSLKLTAPSGKSVKDDSVVVTMDGVDITNDVYTASTDTIDIPAVTGDIVIVATSVNYDAEIEYIQSSGTQWIDTGVVWADGYRYELKAEFLQNGGNFDSILGARQTQGGNKFSVPLALQQDNRPYLQVAEGQAIASNTTLGLYTFKGSQSGAALSIEVNGTTASGTVAGNATAATVSLYMFARHRDDNANNSAAVAKLYYCKIWNGNTLVRDFIPVRVGQVGQLYDKVSGDFFANIGTGSFTLGNDK